MFIFTKLLINNVDLYIPFENCKMIDFTIPRKLSQESLHSHYASITTNNFVTTFLHIFATMPAFDKVKSKFNYLQTILNNGFIANSVKNEFLDLFCGAQRKYHALSKMVYRYKYKHAKTAIQADLFLNPIHNKQSNVVTLYHTGQKYLFTISDITRIITTALSNSPDFFAEPLSIKNPYNNLPLSKANLYTIYFFIQSRFFVMPPLFHAYFLDNFDLTAFCNNNEPMIRKEYIKQFLRNSSMHALSLIIKEMLNEYPRKRRLVIDNNFPKKTLVDVFSPYLPLYLSSQYSLDMNDQYRTKRLLSRRLYEFVNYNPKFGRKYMTTTSKNNRRIVTVHFDDKHIQFKPYKRSYTYETSHLEFKEDDIGNYDFNGNDGYEDSDAESDSIEMTNDDDDPFAVSALMSLRQPATITA